MRMFTKLGATLATGALPVLLWAGAANAQQSPDTTQSQSPNTTVDPCQSQSQSQQSPECTVAPTTIGTVPTTTNTGGTLARTGADDLLPLALGGVAIAGAVAVRGVRRRSVS